MAANLRERLADLAGAESGHADQRVDQMRHSAAPPVSHSAGRARTLFKQRNNVSHMPSMMDLGVANVRQVAMDGTITVAQLTFLERLFHQTQASSQKQRPSAAQGERLEHAGLDRDHFVGIFTKAFGLGAPEIERLFDKLDANADGRVSCDEFLSYMVDKNTRLLKTEETSCFYPTQRACANTLEYGQLERIVSVPGKRVFATIGGQRQILLWSMDSLELLQTIPAPTFPSHGKTPLNDAEFMDYAAGEAALPSSTPPLVQATSRVVDIVYWEDGSANNRFLVALTDNSMFSPFLSIYDAQRGFREVACVTLQDIRSPTCITVMTDPHSKTFFLVGLRDGTCASYEAPTGFAHNTSARMQEVPPGAKPYIYARMHKDCVTQLDVLPVLGRTKIVSTGLDGILSVANVENWGGAQRGERQRHGLNSFAYSARNSFFATAGIDRTVRLWNADSCSILETLTGHKASVVDVVMNDDLHHIVSASADHTVKVWDIRTMKCLQTISTAAHTTNSSHRQELTALHYDSQSRVAVTAGAGVLATWGVETTPGSVVSKRDGEDEMASRSSFSIVRALYCSGFQQLVIVYSNGVAVVSDMETEEPVIRFNTGHASLVTAACLDARERRLITASHSGSVHVHNFNNAALLHIFSPRSSEISELVPLPRISSSSSYSIVASCWDKRVCLWPDKEQTQAGVDVMELSAHKTDVTCVVQYGQYLASGSADGMLMIWYSRSVDFNFARLPKFKYRVPGPEGSRGQPSVTRLLYLPLQHLLLVCIQDGTMHLYSAHGHGLVKASVANAGDGVAAIALAPSENAVVTGDYQGRVTLWDVRSTDGTLLEQRHSTESRAEDVQRRDATRAPMPTWQHDTKAAISSIAFCGLSASPADVAGGLNASQWEVLCSDVEGNIAILKQHHHPSGLDRLVFDHWFGSRETESGPLELDVEIEKRVVKAVSPD